jgi:hypothetical protein
MRCARTRPNDGARRALASLAASGPNRVVEATVESCPHCRAAILTSARRPQAVCDRTWVAPTASKVTRVQLLGESLRLLRPAGGRGPAGAGEGALVESARVLRQSPETILSTSDDGGKIIDTFQEDRKGLLWCVIGNLFIIQILKGFVAMKVVTFQYGKRMSARGYNEFNSKKDASEHDRVPFFFSLFNSYWS